MRNKKDKTLNNMSREEEAMFWDSQDITQYIEGTEVETIDLSPELKKKIRDRYNQRVKSVNYVQIVNQFITYTCTGIIELDECEDDKERNKDDTRYEDIEYENTFEKDYELSVNEN